MKRLLSVFFIGVTCIAAIVSPAHAVAIVKPLVVGMLYEPPFVYNTSTGFDVEVMKNICVLQNVQCQFVLITLDKALADLKAKKGTIDAAMGSIVITPERALTVDFVGPYYRSTMSLLARYGQFDNQVSLNRLVAETIGVEKGSIFYQFLAEVAHTDKHLKTYDSSEDLLQALVEEDVDAIALDTPVAQYWQKKSRCKLQIVGPAMNIPHNEGYGIVLRQGDAALKPLLNEGLKKIEVGGELSRLIHLYFSDSISYC